MGERRRRRETVEAYGRGLADQRADLLPDPGRTTGGAHIDTAYRAGHEHGRATADAWAEVKAVEVGHG